MRPVCTEWHGPIFAFICTCMYLFKYVNVNVFSVGIIQWILLILNFDSWFLKLEYELGSNCLGIYLCQLSVFERREIRRNTTYYKIYGYCKVHLYCWPSWYQHAFLSSPFPVSIVWFEIHLSQNNLVLNMRIVNIRFKHDQVYRQSNVVLVSSTSNVLLPTFLLNFSS